MNPAEKLQKNIGIAVGIIVIVAVGAVTFFKESGPDIASTTPIERHHPHQMSRRKILPQQRLCQAFRFGQCSRRPRGYAGDSAKKDSLYLY